MIPSVFCTFNVSLMNGLFKYVPGYTFTQFLRRINFSDTFNRFFSRQIFDLKKDAKCVDKLENISIPYF